MILTSPLKNAIAGFHVAYRIHLIFQFFFPIVRCALRITKISFRVTRCRSLHTYFRKEGDGIKTEMTVTASRKMDPITRHQLESIRAVLPFRETILDAATMEEIQQERVRVRAYVHACVCQYVGIWE